MQREKCNRLPHANELMMHIHNCANRSLPAQKIKWKCCNTRRALNSKNRSAIEKSAKEMGAGRHTERAAEYIKSSVDVWWVRIHIFPFCEKLAHTKGSTARQLCQCGAGRDRQHRSIRRVDWKHQTRVQPSFCMRFAGRGALRVQPSLLLPRRHADENWSECVCTPIYRGHRRLMWIYGGCAPPDFYSPVSSASKSGPYCARR